jgi:muconate cycloisomerase
VPEETVRQIRHWMTDGRIPRTIRSVEDVWRLSDSFSTDASQNAAGCAVETAALDLLGKYENRPLVAYLPADHATEEIHYSAQITLGNPERVRWFCNHIRRLGIAKVRVKLAEDYQQNRDALRVVREELPGVSDLRMDPNGVWDYQLALRHLPLLSEFDVRVVEEPMVPTDPLFPALAQEVRRAGALLMACESAATVKQVETLIARRSHDIVNVKLCRSGGFARALAIIRRLRRAGIGYQIGCTLGESGILSAAGRALCLRSSDALYYDGSYDRFLLAENTTTEDVGFGPGGRAGELPGPGLGVEVDRESLCRNAVEVVALDLDGSRGRHAAS